MLYHNPGLMIKALASWYIVAQNFSICPAIGGPGARSNVRISQDKLLTSIMMILI